MELQGIRQGPSINLDEASSFKLSRAESKGVWLHLGSTIAQKAATTSQL
jgi:hypothetical protein